MHVYVCRSILTFSEQLYFLKHSHANLTAVVLFLDLAYYHEPLHVCFAYQKTITALFCVSKIRNFSGDLPLSLNLVWSTICAPYIRIIFNTDLLQMLVKHFKTSHCLHFIHVQEKN